VTDTNPALAEAVRDRYLIERELGSGGMAIVYLAEDVRHRRKVALKVLRGELAATMGPERFLREIEVAARLQHPHILPLHDSGEAQGFLYYVMPFVPGHNLRHRVSRQGELPIHEAVKILIEVTDALAYAHSQNVVHRDIKPENILLSGRHALVTDFGVAKAVSEATGRQQLTTAGVALGTPAYMAPEQAAGEPHIDQRVDIYALGILGYELITGRTPFSGRTSQEVLAAHVMQPPVPLGQHRPACPAELENVIMKCLAKRPADRWQTADELLAALEPLATPSGGTTPTTTRPMKSVSTSTAAPRYNRWLIAAGLLLALAGSLLFAFNHRSREVKLGRRLQLTLASGLELDPALSPDGKLVAFVAGALGSTQLYVRQVEGGSPMAISRETDGFVRVPRWSPDGERLVLQTRRGLEVMPALGGASRLLLPLPPRGWIDADVSPDGRYIVYTSGDSVLTLPLDGAASRGLAALPEVHSCTFSPDGRWVACVSGNRQYMMNEAYGNIASSSIWVIPTTGGSPVRISDEKSLNISPAWLPRPTSLLYISNRDGGRDIYQVTLTRSGRPGGDATRLTVGLNASTVSASADGRRLAYATFSRTANVWSFPVPQRGPVKVSGAEQHTVGNQEIEGFDLSPDGRWLVFDSNRGGTQQLYRMPLPSGEVQQLTNGDVPSLAPAISPDGQEIAYHSFKDGFRQLFLIPAEGGSSVQVTSEHAHSRIPNWSPDGRSLVFVRKALSDSQGTAVVSRDSSGRWGPPRTLIKGGASGVWSRDGREILTLVKVANRRYTQVIQPVAGGPQRTIVPPKDRVETGGYAWEFSPDGRWVYYLDVAPNQQKIGIWRVPSHGGAQPTMVALFDQPITEMNRAVMKIRGNRFYYDLGDSQSDIWMTEIVTR
jgi:serine/threonine protein kinase/Tol biopolymer transport system component